jgi:spore coat protein H
MLMAFGKQNLSSSATFFSTLVLQTCKIGAGFACFSLLAGCTETTTPEVFDSTIVHQVAITVDASHLDQLAVDLDNRVPCTIVYDGETIENAGIRQKGNTAVALAGKPSFSVRFDEFVDKSDLQGLNKILLNNSEQDPSFMREKLGADAHTRVGLPTARIAHAQVTLNGADSGIYVVVEAIDADFLRLHFGEGKEEGNLYEGPCCGDFAVDADYRQKDMQLDDEKKDDRNRNDIEALATVIVNATDATFPSDVGRLLDIDQFMKIYALESILLHWDGFAFGKNNYYMYNNPIDLRFVFLPHGMDRTLADLNFDPSPQQVMSRLPQRIHEIPALDTQYKAHYNALESTAWNESVMLSTIDKTAALLNTASGGARTKADLEQFNASLADLRNVVKIVTAQIDP